MDNPLQLKNNLVCLTGKVLSEPSYSHHVFGEGFYEAYLVISRLSEQSDIIPITISERLMKDVPLKTDKIVSIEGQFRSYNKIIDDRSKLMLTVFVRDIAEYDESINFIKNPNQINLIGYVCKNPIFRTTPFNREICDILIAVNRAFNKSDYIPCIAWGRNARFAASLSIGTKLSVSGRIQSREYQK
ncbi:MAG: single-stranded DNA-binding protein, partial [Christensenellaceae bacterium]|nr:single-stranded DNA-binding protein [Christensenellaceae bacterium]